jgi:YVTN family beta-propeller protein
MAVMIAATTPVGPGPLGVAVAPDGSRVYVANQAPGANSLSVIEVGDLAAPARLIAVGKQPWAVAVSPDGKRVYATNSGSNTLSVIDAQTASVVHTISVGQGPKGVAAGPVGDAIFVANSSGGTVTMLDTTVDPPQVRATIAVGSGPSGVAVSPSGDRAFVANSGSNTMSVIDVATATLVGDPVVVGSAPRAITVTPDGRWAYLANEGSGSVSVVDLQASPPKVRRTVITGLRPTAVEASVDGSFVYVTNSGAGTLSVVATAFLGVVATLPIGREPKGVAVASDGIAIYVANSGANTVSALRKSSVALPNSVRSVAVSRDGQRALVVSSFGKVTPGVLSVIDLTGALPTLERTVTLERRSRGVAISPDGRRAYVAAHLTDELLVVDVDGPAEIIDRVGVGSSPFGVAISPDGRTVYAALSSDRALAVVDVSVSPPVLRAPVPLNGTAVNVAITPDGRRVYATVDARIAVVDLSASPPALVTTLTVGQNPGDLAATPDGRRVYVSDNVANVVWAIDNTVTPPVVLPDPIMAGEVLFGLAVSPDGTWIYVGNSSDVTAVDATIDLVADRTAIDFGLLLPVGSKSSGVAVAPDGRVCVTSDSPSTFSVIEPVTTRRAGPAPAGLVLTTDGSRVLVVNSESATNTSGRGTLSVIDVDGPSGGLPLTLGVGRAPTGIAVSPDGQQAYVANTGSRTISVIGLRSGARVLPPIPVDGAPTNLALTPDGKKIFVVIDNDVLVIDATTDSPTARRLNIPGMSPVSALAVTRDGHRVYATSVFDRRVQVIDSSAEPPQLVGTGIELDDRPLGIAFSPNGNRMYVTGEQKLSVIDTTVDPPVPLSSLMIGSSSDIAVSPDGARAYVLLREAGELLTSTISVVDLTANRVVQTIRVGKNATGIALTADGRQAYVANGGSGSISVVSLPDS